MIPEAPLDRLDLRCRRDGGHGAGDALFAPRLDRWTPGILDAIAPVIADLGLPVHDPFAGTGERLGRLCDRLGLPFTGREIEPEFLVGEWRAAA